MSQSALTSAFTRVCGALWRAMATSGAGLPRGTAIPDFAGAQRGRGSTLATVRAPAHPGYGRGH